MADKRINDHIKTTTAANVDEFIIDSDANGTRNITYANLQTQVKQYVLGDMDEVPTQNSNNPVKSGGIYSKIGDLSQTGLTGDSVAAQLGTAKGQISGITTGQKNVWFPDVYDYTTKLKTLNSNICTTYVQKIGDLTVAYLGADNATDLGTFSTMMQLRGFPEGCTRCIGGYIYNESFESSPRVVQASSVGVYFRPNITGNIGSGFASALLFFN